MTVLLAGALCVVGATAVSAGCALLVDKYHPALKRRDNNEVVGMYQLKVPFQRGERLTVEEFVSVAGTLTA